jgi:ubiquitin carboxyl-terminal hydrolase 5/13
VGCGRKQYDGSGGNEHGIQHGNTHQHHVVVKQGTMKPDGTASIWCYKCNDDVKDECLAEHLATLGIDIATQKKTEKTIKERELEMNLSDFLSKTLEDGKVLPPVFGPGFTGMENLGNTCYLNSVVQVVMSMPEFKERYLPSAKDHLDVCKSWTPDCSMCQVSKLAIGLYSGEYSQKKLAVKPISEEASPDQFYQDGIRP